MSASASLISAFICVSIKVISACSMNACSKVSQQHFVLLMGCNGPPKLFRNIGVTLVLVIEATILYLSKSIKKGFCAYVRINASVRHIITRHDHFVTSLENIKRSNTCLFIHNIKQPIEKQ